TGDVLRPLLLQLEFRFHLDEHLWIGTSELYDPGEAVAEVLSALVIGRSKQLQVESVEAEEAAEQLEGGGISTKPRRVQEGPQRFRCGHDLACPAFVAPHRHPRPCPKVCEPERSPHRDGDVGAGAARRYNTRTPPRDVGWSHVANGQTE